MTTDSPLDRLISSIEQKARTPDLFGYKPKFYQKEYHLSKSRGRIVLGGNRSGKSYSAVAEMLLWATGTHPNPEVPKPPLHLRHVAVDKPNGVDKTLKDLYRKLTPKRYLKNGSFEDSWTKEPPTLTLTNGTIIEFMSYAQDLDQHAGTSRHAVAFDEEPDQAIFEENLMRLIDTNGRWWIAMTPIEGMSWVYFDYVLPIEEDTFEQNPDQPRVEVFRFRTQDNDSLNQDAMAELTANLTEKEKLTRLGGEFVSLSGLIYPFDQKRHVIETYHFNPNWLTFTSMDHGLKNPTCWLWLQVDNDGNIYVFDEHYEAGQYVKHHANKVIEKERNLPQGFIAYRTGDPSIVNRTPLNGQSVQSAYSDEGIFIMPGNNDVQIGIDRVGYLLNPVDQEEPRLFIARKCQNLIRELRRYRWDEWASKKATVAKGEKITPKKKDDHAVDALRYAVMSRPYEDSGAYVTPDRTLVPALGSGVAVPSDYSYATFVQDSPGYSYDSELGTEW